MKKSLIIELFLFIILLIILAFLGGKIFKHTFDIGTTYHVAFNDIDSIVIGSPVRILGVDIGHVSKIQTAYNKIYVDFVVTDDKIKIPPGTKATIEFFGIAGSRSIELTPPDKDSQEEGILVRDPIRIGDAFGIMEEFLKATMVSIAGLYYATKGKSQNSFEEDTERMLSATNAADDKIANITGIISEGGAKVHKSILGTTKGMTRVYNEASVFNFGENLYRTRYGIKMYSRSLKEVHKNIKTLNNNMEHHIETLKNQYQKVQDISQKMQTLSEMDKSAENLTRSLENFNKNMTQENLDKIYDSFEKAKESSSELEKSI